MKKKYALLLFTVISYYVQAQKPIATWNHIQYFVHNVDTTAAFFKKMFGADTIPMPWPRIATSRTKWIRLADNTELHIGQNVPDTIPIDNKFHLGLTVVALEEFVKRLVKESTHYISGKYKAPSIDRMPSGAKTTMIRDPDGNRIHLIEAQ